MRITDRKFFTQDGYTLASRLLGKYICRNIDGAVHRGQITETECYLGTEDTACHAHKGKTNRTKIMWQQGGVCYVYLCYGIHNMFNIISGEADNPQGVLIRGVKGYDGPGKLTKTLCIDRSVNGEDLITSDRIWLETGETLPYITTPRIGIGYASNSDQQALWRFVVVEQE